MDPALLEILRCPETHQPIREATSAECEAAGLAEALARADGSAVFPVTNGIPSLLREAAIPLAPPTR